MLLLVAEFEIVRTGVEPISDHQYIKVSHVDQVTVVQFVDPTIEDQSRIAQRTDELLGFIDQENPQRLLIDFDGVTYCAAIVLAGLIDARKGVIAHGGEIRLSGMRPEIRAVFRVCKLEKLFDIDDTKTQGIEAFSSM